MILAIDTALGATSACLASPGAPAPFVSESLPMRTGHAEALIPLIDRVVARGEDGFAAISRVAVTIGPGSFTGIRIGVAAARAIGLACRVPVVGVSTLSVLAGPAMVDGGRLPIVAAVDARHGSIYVQSFGAQGQTLLGPALMALEQAARALGPGPLRVVGSGGPLLSIAASSLGITVEVDDISVPDIAFVARLGALADPAQALPRPFYLKPPDAHPQAASALAPVG